MKILMDVQIHAHPFFNFWTNGPKVGFLEETVLVEEPIYHQKFQAFKYEVEIDGQKKVFAAKEYSMGIYMYFIEE